MSKDAKKIAKDVAKGLRECDLVCDGKKVANAINKLRKERRLTPRELNRQATI